MSDLDTGRLDAWLATHVPGAGAIVAGAWGFALLRGVT